MISMMKSLAQLHSAAILSGLPEPTATKFIADVFIGFSMMNAQGAPEPPEDAVG
jgi:pyrroline-5-carboxylate reductase